jgi:GNAT superfamily N-acetyltransferase
MSDAALVALLERAVLNAVPAPRVLFDGPFVARAHHGGTGRGNAACSLDARPDPELEARVERIARFYARQGLPLRFRCTPLDPPGLAEALRARGCVERDETSVLCGDARAIARADPAVALLGAPEPEWQAVVATAEYQTPARQAEKRDMPALMAAEPGWLVLREAGQTLGCLFVVADGEVCGVFDLAVRPEAKRRGIGARLMGAAAAWGVERGARRLWAQVAMTNTASRGLMARAGLSEAYRYVYRREV